MWKEAVLPYCEEPFCSGISLEGLRNSTWNLNRKTGIWAETERYFWNTNESYVHWTVTFCVLYNGTVTRCPKTHTVIGVKCCSTNWMAISCTLMPSYPLIAVGVLCVSPSAVGVEKLSWCESVTSGQGCRERIQALWIFFFGPFQQERTGQKSLH